MNRQTCSILKENYDDTKVMKERIRKQAELSDSLGSWKMVTAMVTPVAMIHLALITVSGPEEMP